jgi:hypothetical protein
MSPHQSFTSIPLQVGSELRIRNDGELHVSNPTVETGRGAEGAAAADTVLEYRFDPGTSEHVIRVLEPFRLRKRGRADAQRNRM